MWMLIVGIVVLIIGIVYCNWSDDGDGFSMYIGFVGTMFVMIWICSLASDKSYKEGQIDALNNEYKYEQTIKYEQTDTGYAPVDTVYIEITKDK